MIALVAVVMIVGIVVVIASIVMTVVHDFEVDRHRTEKSSSWGRHHSAS